MFVREAALIPVAWGAQFAPRPLLQRRQLRGVNAMLTRACATVPWYRSQPAYDRPPLRSLGDLATLPVLTKQVLRREGRRLLADGVDGADCQVFRTSGSTGARVTVWHDQASHDYHSAALVRRFLATGRYLPTDRLSHIRPFAPPARQFERIGLFRRHVILTEQPFEAIAAQVLANQPRVIIGYPVHLRALLRAMTPDDLHHLRRTLRMVMTESELLLPEQRMAFSHAFGVPVFDEYSAFEVLNISYDCHHGRAHLSEDRLVVEIVDDDGRPLPDGEEGRVVVTAFMERAMPLVRYDLGDRGRIVPDPCPCRRRFRTLELTTGRVNDYVDLGDGRRLYPDTFLHLAATHPGISECYVHQHREGTVELFAMPEDGSGDELRRTVPTRLFEAAGGPFDLKLTLTDEVRTTAGGKGRFITSDLADR